MKAAIKRTLGRSFITFEELRTVLSEVATTINNRPITYSSNTPDDWTPLTPAHFLRGAPLRPPLRDADVLPLDRLDRESIRRKLTDRTTYYKSLVSRWRNEYLTQLRSANKTAKGGEPVIKINDVCLLQDNQKPKASWELVHVLEHHQSRNGKVRTYTVRIRNGYVTRRTAQLLCPLKVA